MSKDKTIQQTLFGEIAEEEFDDDIIANGEFKEIKIEDFEGEHKCPLCGFEWDD